MGKRWNIGRRTKAAPGSDRSDAPADGGALDPESSWWLGQAEPSRVINRRWRKTRPGDLHPRRRATDTNPPREPDLIDAVAEPFDPDALLREQSENLAVDDARIARAGGLEPWAALGLDSDATWDEVVARHRELAKEHHPDKAGADGEAAHAAAERMASINAAFAELGKVYRLSGDR